MITYLIDIIPKIKSLSQKFHNISLLTGNPWIVLKENLNIKEVYIFRKNNQLLISSNGHVLRSKWEYIDNYSLLIENETGCFLLKHGFMDKNILALQLDNTDGYVVFINEIKFNEGINTITKCVSILQKEYLDNGITNTKFLEKCNTAYYEIRSVEDFRSNKRYVFKFNDGFYCFIYQNKNDYKFFLENNQYFDTLDDIINHIKQFRKLR